MPNPLFQPGNKVRIVATKTEFAEMSIFGRTERRRLNNSIVTVEKPCGWADINAYFIIHEVVGRWWIYAKNLQPILKNKQLMLWE